MKPQTAVIICNWNKKDYLLPCIGSVLDQTYRDFDVYVVDNASDDGSAHAVTTQFGGRINLIENETNKGGSGGFNTGIAAALNSGKCYEFLYLLDNDTRAEADALATLVEFMLTRPEAGIAGSKLYYMDGQPGTVQEFGAWLDWERAFIKPNKKNYSEVSHGEITKDIEVDYVPACSLIARTDAVKEVGLLDESYFLYWDDMDWAWRMKLKGYKIFGAAKSKVFHAMGISSKKDLLTTYYFWKNRVRFFKKYGTATTMDILLGDVFTAIYTCEAFEKTNTKEIIYRAAIDGLKDIGGRADFKNAEPSLTLDIRKKFVSMNNARVINVGHVILDAAEADAAIYADPYGNTMAAAEAWKLKLAYHAAKAKFIENLRRQDLVR
ncbi:glycosyltransferase family 2 protein [Candidatus Magnetominusculus dajiuhuensis]|uniref:glycosyltransferase family 2 protein n=1 Tax=Candidatus Magnetominusculus dajiuhuensis TaxID=3137712 RepID=UPI003B42B877